MKNINSLVFLSFIIFTIILAGACKDESTISCPYGYTGINCDEFDPAQVQTLLIQKITPLEFFNEGISLDSIYGKVWEGGFIFYLDTIDGTGKVAALHDAPTKLSWNNANAYCEDLVSVGKDDWYLPSIQDCYIIWEKIADSDGNGINTGISAAPNLGNFLPENYWTSEYYGNWNNWGTAHWIYNFGGGSFRPEIMSYQMNVRAIRNF